MHGFPSLSSEFKFGENVHAKILSSTIGACQNKAKDFVRKQVYQGLKENIYLIILLIFLKKERIYCRFGSINNYVLKHGNHIITIGQCSGPGSVISWLPGSGYYISKILKKLKKKFKYLMVYYLPVLI
jgi:hypothetical protein